MLIEETENIIDPVQHIYMYTGASIDFVHNNVELDSALLENNPDNDYLALFGEKSYHCLQQLANNSRNELIKQAIENAICIFEIDNIAKDLIVVGEDLVTVIQLVHDYHKCMDMESTY